VIVITENFVIVTDQFVPLDFLCFVCEMERI